MLGLFGTLNLGTHSLQAQQTGVEVTGQNLANANNPAYARQRVLIQSSMTLPSAVGPQGTGAQAVSIQQLRNTLLDAQILGEQSTGGYWEAQQSTLQMTQASLGEFLDSSASGVNGSTATGTSGLSTALTSLFSAFHSLAASPASLPEQQNVVNASQTLANRFNEISGRLADIRDGLNSSLSSDVSSTNQLFSDIATLNDQIAKAELPNGGTANDLRDLREQKLEALAKLVNFQSSTEADGSLSISIDGYSFVSGNQVLDRVATFGRGGEFNGGNELLVLSANNQVVLNVSGGSIGGTIDARDRTLEKLRTDLDLLAGQVISQINALYRTGFDRTGATGQDFFAGTGAASIATDSTLLSDPSLIQSAGQAGAPGDNSVILALAQLANQPNAALGDQTFSGAFGKVVGDFGHTLQSVNEQLDNHETVNRLMLRQRDSVSGVSIDEEMTNLLSYQKAYQASAKIVTTVDEMLDTILNLKR